MAKKVILLGKFGVGKTSLISQFVHNVFSEKYLTTIGVKIDKKVIDVNGESMSMIIWDIAGESSHTKVPSNYKLGAHGVLFVFDLTRPSTYEHIQSELDELAKILPDVPIQIVANKIDLVSSSHVDDVLSRIGLDILLCSAKNGQNVEKAFSDLGLEML